MIVAIACAAAMSLPALAAKARAKKKERVRVQHAREVPAAGEPAVSGDDMAPERKSGTAQTEAQPPPYPPLNLYALLHHEDLVAELERRHLAGGSLAVLLERLTRGLVAAPYLLSPLGEGAMPDPDPRFRWDAFDCTTFVETAIALAQCDSPAEIAAALDRVRYAGGVVAFEKRHHLMASDWVPSLIAQGYLEDVTARVGGKETKRVSLHLDEVRWKRRRIARQLVLPAEVVPSGTFELPYVPLEVLIARTSSVPAGTILNVVRGDVPFSPEVVTHQGLILVRPGERGRIVRHASPISRRVIDEGLEHMLRRYQKLEGWRVVGINLLRILEPRAARR